MNADCPDLTLSQDDSPAWLMLPSFAILGNPEDGSGRMSTSEPGGRTAIGEKIRPDRGLQFRSYRHGDARSALDRGADGRLESVLSSCYYVRATRSVFWRRARVEGARPQGEAAIRSVQLLPAPVSCLVAPSPMRAAPSVPGAAAAPRGRAAPALPPARPG